MDFDEYVAQQSPRTQCTVCCLPEELKAEVERVMNHPDRRYNAVALSRWLETKDFEIQDQSIRRHMKRHV